jgi:di/tripeptidase
MAIHGKQEYVFVQDMEMAMLTIAEVVKIYEEKA